MTALPSWVDPEAWQGFVDMRKSIKRPLTLRAEALVLKTLLQMKDRGHDPNEALDQSVIHNWQDVYVPKPKDVPNLKPATYQAEPQMTEAEKASSDEARKRVMDMLRPAIKRVA